jgi:hypothetical protein
MQTVPLNRRAYRTALETGAELWAAGSTFRAAYWATGSPQRLALSRCLWPSLIAVSSAERAA